MWGDMQTDHYHWAVISRACADENENRYGSTRAVRNVVPPHQDSVNEEGDDEALTRKAHLAWHAWQSAMPPPGIPVVLTDSPSSSNMRPAGSCRPPPPPPLRPGPVRPGRDEVPGGGDDPRRLR